MAEAKAGGSYLWSELYSLAIIPTNIFSRPPCYGLEKAFFSFLLHDHILIGCVNKLTVRNSEWNLLDYQLDSEHISIVLNMGYEDFKFCEGYSSLAHNAFLTNDS